MEGTTPIERKEPVKLPMLILGAVVITAIAGGVGVYLGAFSNELGSQIKGISGALHSSDRKDTPMPAAQPIPPVEPSAPKEEPKPAVGALLQLSVGSTVSVPVALAGSTLTMKLTLVSIEKYGTPNFKAKVKSQVTETMADGTVAVKSNENHTFTLGARSFSQGGFDIVMAGYNESAIGVVMDYKAF